MQFILSFRKQDSLLWKLLTKYNPYKLDPQLCV